MAKKWIKPSDEEWRGLNAAQVRVALLASLGFRVSDIAEKLNIPAPSIWGLAQTPAFQSLLNAYLRDSIESLGRQAVNHQLAAMSVLLEICQDASIEPKDRVSAAKVLLDIPRPPIPSTPECDPDQLARIHKATAPINPDDITDLLY